MNLSLKKLEKDNFEEVKTKFKKGESIRQVPEAELLTALLTEVAALSGEAVELP